MHRFFCPRPRSPRCAGLLAWARPRPVATLRTRAYPAGGGICACCLLGARASSVSYPRVGQNLLQPSEVSCGSVLCDSYGVAQPRLHNPGCAKNADLAPGAANAPAPAHVPARACKAGRTGRPAVD